MRFTKSVWALFVAVIALCLGTVPMAAAGDDKASGKNQANRYIVRMLDRPVVAYEGDVPGHEATKPAKGAKIDPEDAKVAK